MNWVRAYYCSLMRNVDVTYGMVPPGLARGRVPGYTIIMKDSPNKTQDLLEGHTLHVGPIKPCYYTIKGIVIISLWLCLTSNRR